MKNEFITYVDEYGNTCHTNMMTMEQALARTAWAKQRRLNTPVDKRTRFYKYLVDEGIVEAGTTIYNKDCINILDKSKLV